MARTSKTVLNNTSERGHSFLALFLILAEMFFRMVVAVGLLCTDFMMLSRFLLCPLSGVFLTNGF